MRDHKNGASRGPQLVEESSLSSHLWHDAAYQLFIRRRLLRAARRLCPPQDIEDLVQVALLRLHEIQEKGGASIALSG